MKHSLWLRQRLVAPILVGILVAAFGVFCLTTRAAVETAPAPAREAITLPAPAAAFSTAQLADAYDAAKRAQRAGSDVMNAVHALRNGQVAGVELTAEQRTAIKEKGFSGLIRIYRRWQNTLAILNVTQEQLVTWEEMHPQPGPCYESLGCTPPGGE